MLFILFRKVYRMQRLGSVKQCQLGGSPWIRKLKEAQEFLERYGIQFSVCENLYQIG